MINKPLYQNPLAGGGPQELTEDQLKMTIFDNTPVPKGGAPDMGKYEGNPYANPLAGGGPQLTPIVNDFKPKSDDPLMQGYYDSEFFSNLATADMVPYTFQGKEMTGSSSQAGNLKKYLESIGKGDLLQFKNNDVMSVDLAKIAGPEDSLTEPGFDSQQPPGAESIFTGNATLPDNITNNFLGDGIFSSPFETTGQYLTGPNEPNNILETLKKIEQGIAGLGGNFGQGNNINQSSNYGDFDNFGIGSFFPPYGGMYG
mgnify:CR=1 FL=1